MNKTTNITYEIRTPKGDLERCGCIRKYFHGAFKRMQYLKKVYGSLIKFKKSCEQ